MATQQPNYQTHRVRVRTPGKYIVLGAVLVAGLVALTVSLVRRPIDLEGAMAKFEAVSEDQSLTFEPFLVDLAADRDGRIAFLKLNARVYFATADAARTASEREDVIRERLTFFLRELSPEDFSGTAGMERVKKEMLRRVNLFAGGPIAETVVISDLIIQ